MITKSKIMKSAKSQGEPRILGIIVTAISLLYLGMPTSALSDSRCPKGTKGPVQCFAVEARQEAAMCTLEVELALTKNTGDYSCRDKAKAKLKPYYEQADSALRSRPEIQKLLRDTYAHWLTYVSALAPAYNEREFLYRARIQQLDQTFESLFNRLMLEG